MSKIKLIAVDLDGTLLTDNREIHKKNRYYLKKFSKKGGIVVLSSGRMSNSVSPFSNKLGIDCPLIAYNGAMARLKKSENRKIIFHKPLPSKYSDYIIDYCLKNKFLLNFYINDKLYSQNDPGLKKYALIYSTQTNSKYTFLDNLAKLKGKSPTKLILITDNKNKDIERTRDYQYKFFKRIFKDKLKIVRTNPEYLEFMNKNVDKSVALKKIAQYYKVKKEEIISFGDGENDIEMMSFCRFSVSPSNAKEDVKKIATISLKYSNNDGFIGELLKILDF
ncbi:MAG TPA: HAD family hydrolase [Candidatus Ratteibacteria bacterium]|nr:HAD family hydrolase [Candidatus Ratteibacteria bacterium]